MRIAALGLLLVAPVVGQSRFDDSGFTPLFDGESLAGWVEKGGRYDGEALWSVEDGALTGRQGPGQAGGLIYTGRYYTNFIFSCDLWISYPFDSGIFLRMVPRSDGGKGPQVTIDYRPDGEVGAIYADGFLMHNEEAKAAFRRDEWNHFEVRCVGRDFHLEVWMNGELITDYQLPESSDGYAPTGRIGLQVHGSRNDPEGSKVQFKNLRILELPDFDPQWFDCDAQGRLSPTAQGAEAGWKALFDGVDLSAWELSSGSIADGGYLVRDGLLVFPKDGPDGHLRTRADFEDFELRLDFRQGPHCNSGVFLRADRVRGNPSYSGCEIQILDDTAWSEGELKPWQVTGSLYGAIPPGQSALKPLGSWNTLEARFIGSRLRVELNGRQLYDVDTHQLEVAQGGPFAERARRGFIGLQRHAPDQVEGEYAWFKNIYVREVAD